MDSGIIKELSMKIRSHPNLPEPKGKRLHIKMDTGAVKDLSMKSSKCHPNPLEPEGEQPVAKMVENKMVENMKNNYLKEVSIQEELKKVKIENYLEFFGDGRYEFYKCSGCLGPKLGHIIQKCTKLEYDKETLQKFEIYLKEIGGFKEAI